MQILETIYAEREEERAPARQFTTIEDVTTWFIEQRERITHLPIDEYTRDEHLTRLNATYADLSEQHVGGTAMRHIRLGTDVQTNGPVYFPVDALKRHLHLVGATGTGKTTLILLLLHSLFQKSPCGFIIIDLLGGFSWDLLMWMASRFCPAHVRDRLIYFEAAREDIVFPFNPLPHDSPSHGFYRVMRAVEVILRGWESQNIEAMPRLARWIFNAFWAAARLGLTISDCVHFLMPNSPLHERLIALLPENSQYEWSEITHGRPADVARILESVRNRLKPFIENDILRRMFGGTQNRLDILRFMRERKSLIINLSPKNRLSPQVSHAIAGLITNEMQAVARSLPEGETLPIVCVLDEFHNFVGQDFETAIPEMRQKGVSFLCSHQSYSQLVRGDTDLRGIVHQLQNRFTFGIHGEDADIVAHELAALTYDPNRIKEELFSTRQRIAGHKLVELESSSESFGQSDSSSSTSGFSSNDGRSRRLLAGISDDSYTLSTGGGGSSSTQSGNSHSTSRTRGHSQSLLPIHEEYQELSSRSYVAMPEQETLWGQRVRRLPVGHALLKIADVPMPRKVRIHRSAPGFLGFDMATIRRRFPWAIEDTYRLIEENFARGPFCTPAEIDRETELRLNRVLNGHIVIPNSTAISDVPAAPVNTPFA